MTHVSQIIILLTASCFLATATFGAETKILNLSPAPGKKTVGFTLLEPAQTGIAFTNFISERRHLTNRILLNGSGGAAGDVDHDGWTDLFFCGLNGTSTLYRNLGQWRFEDATSTANLNLAGFTATGCTLADVNGDGSLDLLVNTLGQGTHLYLNDGRGRFHERLPVLNGNHGGMSMALGDVDGDGYLDLYIANYRTLGLMDVPNARGTFKKVDGKTVLDTFNGRSTTNTELKDRFTIGPRGNIVELGEPDSYYRNSGGTNFTLVPFTGGTFLDENGKALTAPLLDWGLSVMIRDANGDGLPDIYVCNDFQTEDRFWLNQGNGVLRLVSPRAQRKASLFSMGIDFADINRDGHDDFFVLDMLSREHPQRMRDLTDGNPPSYVPGDFLNRPQYGLNTLFLSRGDGTWSEIAQLSGLHAAEWAWSCIFLDVDLDGWEDLLVSNGMERAGRNLDVADRMKALRASRRLTDAEVFEARRQFPRLATANLAFQNRRDLTFQEVGHAWGFDLEGVSHGMLLADLDNDGDLDVVLNNLNAAASIYRNETVAPRVAVKLKGRSPNTHGVGARITLKTPRLPNQAQEIVAGGRYLSSDAPLRTFAAGRGQSGMELEVKWRSGRRTKVSNVEANKLYEIMEEGEQPPFSPAPLAARPLFEAKILGNRSQETVFDDFARQPLLPNKLSHLGPGCAWSDIDGDGWDDLVIGAGAAGSLSVFRNNQGSLEPATNSPFSQLMTRDQAGIAVLSADGARTILTALANHEDGLSLGTKVLGYNSGQDLPVPIAQAGDSSPGPIALADIDQDGDLDLFLGGRVMQGKYPFAASSQLLRNNRNKFEPDTINSNILQNIGMVSGATFSDIDGDGDQDLLLALEWGSIRLLLNTRGKFDDATEKWGLAKYEGWWNGVVAGDFDGDGRMDFAASNWGRNTKYEEHRKSPLLMYYGDFDGDGTVDILEAHHDPVLGKIVPERPLTVLGKAMAFLKERFPTHESFCMAGVAEILGPRFESAAKLSANWLESSIFLNRGDRFEGRALPVEAQMSPAFGLAAGDFNGDGNVDLVLAQNFYGSQPLTPRYDAGLGLLLLGDGAGQFRALKPVESGIHVYGEQRGVACGDFDQDGRLDVLITQNSAPAILHHNKGAAVGLRIRLEGTAGNPEAIGASLVLKTGTSLSPRFQVDSGSGYWSQNSHTLVLKRPEAAATLEVRWPDGRTTATPLAAGSSSIHVKSDGSVELD